MPQTACRLLVLGVAVLAGGCHRGHRPIARVPQPPPPTSTGAVPAAPIIQGEQGLASWYGHPYHGRPTTDGEIYNMYELTAAHRTLPFNTQVRVHDLDNGRDVTVRINDRGPFIEGRIIDLSYASARAIDMIGPGVARVQLEILGMPPPGSPGGEPGVYAVQVGAFRNWSNALTPSSSRALIAATASSTECAWATKPLRKAPSNSRSTCARPALPRKHSSFG